MLRYLSLLLICFSLVLSHSEHLPSLLKFMKATKHTLLPRKANFGNENQFFKNIRNITNGGTNAESYWSFDGTKFSFQAIRTPLSKTHSCDQIYSMDADGRNVRLVSTGKGRDTCSYYYPDGMSSLLHDGKLVEGVDVIGYLIHVLGFNIIYSSTTSQDPCPPTPDQSYGYVWPIYKDMDIFLRNTQTNGLSVLFNSSGYDAESTISPDGQKIIFTSTRDGDLELYTMNLDGSEVRRLTYTPGYDGGAYFSNDNSMFTWRANRPRGEDMLEYFRLLDYGIVAPSGMQVMVQDIHLVNPPMQLTNNNGTNFAPFFLPDDSGVIFSSNLHDPYGGDFQLYTVKLDVSLDVILIVQGTGLTRITTEGNFNSFPMFSPDGSKLAWCSDRNAKTFGQIDVFVADWTGPGKLSNIRQHRPHKNTKVSKN